jgi:hypothetical protein
MSEPHEVAMYQKNEMGRSYKMVDRVFSINLGLGVVVDYIDLKGELQSLTLEVSDEIEAVDSIRTAWNENLLWYFKLHLEQRQPLSQTRLIPWPQAVLKRALALPRLHRHIQGLGRSIALYEKKVVSSFSESNNGPAPRDLEILADTFSSLRALEAVNDGLIKELESQGIRVTGLLDEERMHALEYTARAAKSLEEMNAKTSPSNDVSFFMGRTRRLKASEFVDCLPRVSGIFSNDTTDESIPFLENTI